MRFFKKKKVLKDLEKVKLLENKICFSYLSGTNSWFSRNSLFNND